MVEQDLKVKPAFKAVLGALSTQEFEQLEANIVNEGRITDPIMFWNHKGTNWIVDGMNRFAIAMKHKVPFRTEPIIFNDEADAIMWIRRRQAGRRNLTDEKYRYLWGCIYNETKGTHGGSTTEEARVDVAEKLAEEFSVSPRTITRSGEFAEVMDELSLPVRNAVLNRELKASTAEVKALATLDAGKQQQVARDVRVGNSPSLEAALKKHGAKMPKPKKPAAAKPAPTPKKGPCEISESGQHQWESDGEYKRFCAHCKEDHPDNDKRVDARKVIIPDKIVSAFNDPTFDLYKDVEDIVKKVKSIKGKHGAYLDMSIVVEKLTEGAKGLRDAKPSVVCPECKGDGCSWCRKSGWMPAWEYNNWKAKAGKEKK